nr:60-kDa chaperonin [Meringosphaera mediterranea]
MPGKKILYKDEARRALVHGMSIMVEAVSVTLGPKGRNVVLEKKNRQPQIINDGVSIAREIELLNPIENTGVALIRQAASKTNDVAGDGTTTATVLAYAIVREGMRNLTMGANPVSLKVGLEKSLKFLISQINEYSRPIEDLQSISQVAAISAGNDVEIGNLISKAIGKVGRDGVISLEESKSTQVELDISEGMRFDKGFISPYFVTNPERMEVVLDNPFILITDKKISLVREQLVPILEQISKTKRPLLIIASDVEKEVLTTLILNKLKNTIDVAAVRAPSFGVLRKQILNDIGILTQGQVITEETGLNLSSISLDLLGQARRIVVTKNDTTIINEGTKKEVNRHCESLRKQISISDDIYQKERLQDRIAKLSGGVGIIRVGAVTETEMRDKKLRLEDAINATRAAIEEGIVPGGGSLFVHLSTMLKKWAKQNLKEDELIGALILEKAILAPIKRIAENAGKNSFLVLETVEQGNFNFGYNASNDTFGDMYSFGIIDPAKVTRSALQNATSIAGMILTTECIVVENP